MSQKLQAHSLLMKLYPLWLREKLFWKFYSIVKFESLCNHAILEFAPLVSLKLMPTDISHKMIAFCGFYELQLSRYITKLAKAGGLMVDVGANYGYYSCLWASLNVWYFHLAGVTFMLANQLLSMSKAPPNWANSLTLKKISREYLAIAYYNEMEAALHISHRGKAILACIGILLAAVRSRTGLTIWHYKVIIRGVLGKQLRETPLHSN